jgi:hypothetical protein
MNQKFAINEMVLGPGIVAEGDLVCDDHVKFIILGVGEIEVYGRISGQTNWDLIDTISSDKIIKVSMFHNLRVTCTSGSFQLIAVGFDDGN